MHVVKKWILLLTYFSNSMHLTTSLTCICCIGNATLSLQSHEASASLGSATLYYMWGKWSPSFKRTVTEMVDFFFFFPSATWHRDLITTLSTIGIRTRVYVWLNILDASEIIVVEVFGVCLLEHFLLLKLRMSCDLPKNIHKTVKEPSDVRQKSWCNKQ